MLLTNAMSLDSYIISVDRCRVTSSFDCSRIIYCQSVGDSCTAIVCYNKEFEEPEELPEEKKKKIHVEYWRRAFLDQYLHESNLICRHFLLLIFDMAVRTWAWMNFHILQIRQVFHCTLYRNLPHKSGATTRELRR